MPVIVVYLLKTIIISGILYSYYRVVLYNSLFHQWNRFFLLGATVFSIIIPLISISLPATEGDNNHGLTRLLEVVATDHYEEYENTGTATIKFDLYKSGLILYSAVSSIMMAMLLAGLWRLLHLNKKNPRLDIKGVHLILTKEKDAPFSFFRNIFWKTGIMLHSPEGNRIFEHEMVHVREVHSADRLFINIVLVFSWFNPFYWLIKKEMTLVHEFIADKKTITNNDVADFSQMVLSAAYPGYQFGTVSKFSSSSLKRRLRMLTKIKNPSVNYLSRLLILPLLLIIIAAFTLKTKNLPVTNSSSPITVMIDAGHGGNDAGADSKKGVLEKNINLLIARKIQELNNDKNIKIVLTRSDDKAVELKQRTAKALTEKAALFISLHVNNDISSPSGFDFLISNKNFKQEKESQLLGSYISQELGKLYPVSQELKKSKDQGIWVLDAPEINYPALLIECGNLAYQKDLDFITDASNQQKIAESILKAISLFYKQNTGNIEQSLIKDMAPTIHFLSIFKDRDSAVISFTDKNHDVVKIRGLNTMTAEKINLQNWEQFTDATFIIFNGSQIKSIEDIDKDNLKSVAIGSVIDNKKYSRVLLLTSKEGVVFR